MEMIVQSLKLDIRGSSAARKGSQKPLDEF